MPKHKTKRRKHNIAATADKYVYYQRSVQEPGHEVGFFLRAYRDAYHAKPTLLREDFCGTFAVCCEWVKAGSDHQAVGVDLDPEPLTWGRDHNLAKLDQEEQSRVKLLQQDVRDVTAPKADVLAAENFSYWIFKTRAELVTYFQAARANLKAKGVFVLDLMGGGSIMKEDQRDIKKYKGFKYIWEQVRFDPITHACKFHIHFKFKDGSKLEKAFTYDWRMWTVPELCELILEAGFKKAEVYWEGTDEKTGEGDSDFKRRKNVTPDDCWIAYVVGVK
jgi:hypothetical protein